MKPTRPHVTTAITGAVLCLLAGCVSGSDNNPEISCPPDRLEFRGTAYTGERVDADAVRLGRALEDAVVSECGIETEPVGVSAIKGVPPEVAFVTSEPRRRLVYWPTSRGDKPPAAVRRLLQGT